MQYLGFQVTVDQSAAQIGVACGYVSARNAVKLQLSLILDTTPNLRDSVHNEWIIDGNERLREHYDSQIERLRTTLSACSNNPTRAGSALATSTQLSLADAEARLAKISGSRRDESMNLYTEEVMLLASQWLSDEVASHGRDMMTQSEPTDFLTSVNSFDLTLRDVIEDVKAAEASNPLSSPRNPRGPEEMRIRISNTCNGDSRGAHWFTLAYTISQRAAPPGPHNRWHEAMLDQ